jgi:GMP synthase (glutamine-hydrolysing)
VIRVLYISQLAGLEHPQRGGVAEEAARTPGLLALAGIDATLCDAPSAVLPDPRGFDGVIVGGSFGSANAEEPWRVALREWLATWQSVPLFGICGGHQLLARALGGEIEEGTASQHGIYPLALPGVPGWRDRVVELHTDHVKVPPPGAEVWAQDTTCIQALRYGRTRWTVQFHPEMDEDLVMLAAQNGGLTCPWTDLPLAVEGGRALLRHWADAVRCA